MNSYDCFILNIKSIMEQKGLKQKAVAAQTGLKAQELSNMLNRRKLIRAFDVPKIAEALGVTPNELFGISSPQPPHPPTV